MSSRICNAFDLDITCLSDCLCENMQDNDVLTWSASDEVWINQQPSGGGSSSVSLTSTTLTCNPSNITGIGIINLPDVATGASLNHPAFIQFDNKGRILNTSAYASAPILDIQSNSPSILTTNIEGSTYTLYIADQGLTTGSYINTNITVNSKGLITAISNGSRGGGSSLELAYYKNITTNIALSEATITNFTNLATTIYSNSNFNTSTGIYTCPSSGLYFFHVLSTIVVGSYAIWRIFIKVNTTQNIVFSQNLDSASGSTTQIINVGGYFHLTTGDIVQAQIFVASGSGNYGLYQLTIQQIA